jgi:hypothetical protein
MGGDMLLRCERERQTSLVAVVSGLRVCRQLLRLRKLRGRSETGLDYRWAQGNVWHMGILIWNATQTRCSRSVGRETSYLATT